MNTLGKKKKNGKLGRKKDGQENKGRRKESKRHITEYIPKEIRKERSIKINE